eukprot:TRINITY_DN4133_c0_g1_i1.p1 TRINITY_DN4133_c0_g1~~TRINITY_DN4133_c0_g1_i1.p1  ORF type:complete len:406 (-),score=147.02 TRINITY_DN4133_c0_g1_i1:422-1477(-)
MVLYDWQRGKIPFFTPPPSTGPREGAAPSAVPPTSAPAQVTEALGEDADGGAGDASGEGEDEEGKRQSAAQDKAVEAARHAMDAAAAKHQRLRVPVLAGFFNEEDQKAQGDEAMEEEEREEEEEIGEEGGEDEEGDEVSEDESKGSGDDDEEGEEGSGREGEKGAGSEQAGVSFGAEGTAGEDGERELTWEEVLQCVREQQEQDGGVPDEEESEQQLPKSHKQQQRAAVLEGGRKRGKSAGNAENGNVASGRKGRSHGKETQDNNLAPQVEASRDGLNSKKRSREAEGEAGPTPQGKRAKGLQQQAGFPVGARQGRKEQKAVRIGERKREWSGKLEKPKRGTKPGPEADED